MGARPAPEILGRKARGMPLPIGPQASSGACVERRRLLFFMIPIRRSYLFFLNPLRPRLSRHRCAPAPVSATSPFRRATAREGVRSGLQSKRNGPVDHFERRTPRAWASGRTGGCRIVSTRLEIPGTAHTVIAHRRAIRFPSLEFIASCQLCAKSGHSLSDANLLESGDKMEGRT
jgi:hypothetical protein